MSTAFIVVGLFILAIIAVIFISWLRRPPCPVCGSYKNKIDLDIGPGTYRRCYNCFHYWLWDFGQR